MRKAARHALAWGFYYAGHAVSRPLVWWGWYCLYTPYSFLMGISSKLDRENRIWKPEA
jgi:hypothetical protein